MRINKLDGDTASIKITRMKPEVGKQILITADVDGGKIQIPLDTRCLGNTDEDKYCKSCTLRIRCFTSDALRIEPKEFNGLPVGDFATITDLVQAFLAKHGMRLTFTKACAILEVDETTL